jgi:hypothetical protein
MTAAYAIPLFLAVMVGGVVLDAATGGWDTISWGPLLVLPVLATSLFVLRRRRNGGRATEWAVANAGCPCGWGLSAPSRYRRRSWSRALMNMAAPVTICSEPMTVGVVPSVTRM